MIKSYFEEIILMLSETPYVDSFDVIKNKITSTEGYLRLKANLVNSDLLEISLYCQKKEASIEIIDYRYHWQDENGVLKMRWDNCKHHKGIKTFPFHVHVDDYKTVKPSAKIDIYKVFEIIGKNINTK